VTVTVYRPTPSRFLATFPVNVIFVVPWTAFAFTVPIAIRRVQDFARRLRLVGATHRALRPLPLRLPLRSAANAMRAVPASLERKTTNVFLFAFTFAGVNRRPLTTGLVVSLGGLSPPPGGGGVVPATAHAPPIARS